MAESSESGERRIYTDPQGREFHYIYFDNGHSQLGVHFSAFFGDWGDAPKYRSTFGGYFHRLKMLSSDQALDWLFLCDAYGADENGTYYIGRQSDRFVEQAVRAILADVGVGDRYQPTSIVMIGSSMGATGALRNGLALAVKGIVAISPHIDLDTSAKLQGRERHVAWILDDGHTQSPSNHGVTRDIRRAVDAYLASDRRLPDLFIQSCRDDIGVHHEQVLPLVEQWSRGGLVMLDERRSGGHTSEYATRELILDAVHSLLENSPIVVFKYKWQRRFRPYGMCKGFYTRCRRGVGKLKRATVGRTSKVPEE